MISILLSLQQRAVCNTLRQLGMVSLHWKEVCSSDGWPPFKFCHPPLGALFQPTYPVGWNQTGSSFFSCPTKLSKPKFLQSEANIRHTLFVYCLVGWDFDFLCYNRMRFYAYYVSVVSRPKHHVLARLSEAKLAEDKHAPPLLYSSSYKVFGQPSSLPDSNLSNQLQAYFATPRLSSD